MTQRLRSESGFALLGAMLILIIMMGIGLAIVSLNDTQQNLSGGERVKESSFNLGEAALNAEALQLGRTWPTSTSPATTDCDPTTSGTSYCPLSSAIMNGYTTRDYATACSTNASAKLWQTQVRDNTNGSYWSTAINSSARYDANGDNTMWVRSFATVQCKPVSMVALVSYTANLSRIGQSLLGVDAAWEKWSRLRPAKERDHFLAETLGPQYPWYWSAGVLAVLLGLSACILNYQIRSLDRLK